MGWPLKGWRVCGLTPTSPFIRGSTLDDLRAAIADADAVVVRSRTCLDGEILAHAHALRVIARAGVGVDNIDVEAATRRGILVLNTPDSSTISTAEHTMAMMLALVRHLPTAHLSTSLKAVQVAHSDAQ